MDYCDRPRPQVVLGEDCRRSLELCARKVTDVQSLIGCSGNLEDNQKAIQTTEAWLGKFQREAKTLCKKLN